MAARTDADGRKRGRVPAIGDWADGVHRGVARASSPKRRPKTQGQGRAAGRVNGAGVEVSKRILAGIKWPDSVTAISD